MSVGALAAIFGTSFVVSLTGALSPGPLTTLAVREGVRRGFWAGPALALGHGAVELALVVALALGLERALDRDWVAAIVALAGGTFLLGLGVRIVWTAPRQELRIGGGEAVAEAGAASLPGLLASGVVVSAANPFWLLWWLTIGAAYIAEALDEGVAGVGAFYGAHILTDLGWLSLIALALASGRRVMSRWAYRVVLGACGAFLLVLGGWFVASGVGYAV
jgi:threonine/homoserine/homoserine lactone efflux protein